jgi:hypothetical protein
MLSRTSITEKKRNENPRYIAKRRNKPTDGGRKLFKSVKSSEAEKEEGHD